MKRRNDAFKKIYRNNFNFRILEFFLKMIYINHLVLSIIFLIYN